jgi:hypothetical protein
LYNGGASTTNGTTVGLLTTYAINPVPDFLAKVTFDPGLGHYEVFGIGRFFRDRVFQYSCPTTATSCTSSTDTGGTISNSYNDTEFSGGLGGSARVPLFNKKLDVGLKGLWGTGVGRYGDSTIADVTIKPNGEFSPLHNFSGLSTLELHATPRLDIYANYGGDYVGKTIYLTTAGKKDGYGLGESFTGCGTEVLPTGPTYPASNSGCTGQTKDLQESTIGYWYDFYKGPKGRLRQGIQYSYAERFIWDNVALTTGNVSPKGIENMFWTSFRYYIP